MEFLVPLPQRVRDCLPHNTHPGLLLDKYVESSDPSAPTGKLSELVQMPTVKKVAKLSQQPPEGFDYSKFRERRGRMLECLGGVAFTCTTVGPLTLHLARASALENAGICLHPLYGFVYLPGSGLKGMARAYAETVWLPAQSDSVAAWRQVEAVFGWAPNSDDRKHWKPETVPRHTPEDAASAGDIIFHDAWPKQWPRLLHDLINNHHRDYYGAAPGDNRHPPGDWETPNMVSFLAVVPGTTFSFALSNRRPFEPSDALLSLARGWLTGALCHEGAGAKTAAGYGYFKPDDSPVPSLPESGRPLREYTLELVTPAFLAGADQEKPEDCQLRPATLRGLLRWWWRTLHAGFVDVATLRKMEAAVWGDTNAGGAVRVAVRPLGELPPLPYDKRFIVHKNALPAPPNNKTTQGLWYHSYGMDEQKGRRSFLAPGARWSLSLSARQSYYPTDLERKKATTVEAQFILGQAEAALWLLCHFGGVGSKSRRGFGSFADPAGLGGMDLERCGQAAERFRNVCGLGESTFQASRAESPALKLMLPFPDIPTFWKNYWMALDQVGEVAQQFAQLWKHDVQKKALGLPRNVRPPVKGAFRPGPRVQQTGRHAAPVFYHLARGLDGNFVVRVTAFPAPQLPDLPTSQTFLQMLLVHFQAKLTQRALEHKSKGPMPPINPGTATDRATAVQPLTAGSQVEALLAEDPKRQGRAFAFHVGTGRVGPIINPKEAPADQKDKQIGNQVTLILHSVSSDGKQIQFRWPRAADSQPRSARPQGGPPRRGGPGGRPNRR